jgi:CRP-like cAMP-binding protein
MNESIVAKQNLNELYRSLPEETRRKLEQYEQTKAVPVGTGLITEGVPTENVIVLKSGSAEVSIASGGQEIPVGVARAGKVFGLRSVVSGEAPEISVTTLEECTVSLIPKDRLTAVLKQDHQMYIAVARVLSEDLRMVNDLLRRIPRTATGRYRTANAYKAM